MPGQAYRVGTVVLDAAMVKIGWIIRHGVIAELAAEMGKVESLNPRSFEWCKITFVRHGRIHRQYIMELVAGYGTTLAYSEMSLALPGLVSYV